jgi:hypothetical protein
MLLYLDWESPNSWLSRMKKDSSIVVKFGLWVHRDEDRPKRYGEALFPDKFRQVHEMQGHNVGIRSNK